MWETQNLCKLEMTLLNRVLPFDIYANLGCELSMKMVIRYMTFVFEIGNFYLRLKIFILG